MAWDPTRFFRWGCSLTRPYAIVILHQPINQAAYDQVSKRASLTICADGGSNRFYDLMVKKGVERTELPSAIVGDLDSIRPDVRKHYEDLQVPVISKPDQYSTDFAKCLVYLQDILMEGSLDKFQIPNNVPARMDILVLSGLGGRVDAAFSQLHYLYRGYLFSNHDARIPLGDIYLLSESSITFVLEKGMNNILTPGGSNLAAKAFAINEAKDSANKDKPYDTDSSCYLSENVGILPIGGPSVINTKGFEWDVHDWRTEFGGNISTSNHIRADQVEIQTTERVLFTLELADSLKVSDEE